MSTPPPNNTSSPPNLYFDLELFLDPPEVDFAKLKTVLADKITEWNLLVNAPGSQGTRFSHMVQVAESFRSRTTEPGPASGEPMERSLNNQAKEAKTGREAKGKRIADILQRRGVLYERTYNNFLKKYQPFFKEETIKSWFRLVITSDSSHVGFIVPKEPSYPPGLKEKIVPKSQMDAIAIDLMTVCGNQNASLYNLLGLPSTTNLTTIQQKQSDKYNEAILRPVAPQVKAEINVLGQAKLIFADEISRQGYDIALRRRPFDHLIDDIFASRVLTTTSATVSDDDYIDSVWDTVHAGLPQAEAEWYVYNYYCIIRKCKEPTKSIDPVKDSGFICLKEIFQLILENANPGQPQTPNAFSVEDYVHELRMEDLNARYKKIVSDVRFFLRNESSDVKRHLFFAFSVEDFVRDLNQVDPVDSARCFDLLEETFLAKMKPRMKERYFVYVNEHFGDPRNPANRKKHLFLYLSLLLCLYADQENTYRSYFAELFKIEFDDAEFRNFINETLDILISKAVIPTVYEQMMQLHLAKGPNGRDNFDFVKEYDYFSRLQKYGLHLWKNGKAAQAQGVAFLRYVLNTKDKEWAFWKDQSNIVDSLLEIPMNDNKVKKDVLTKIHTHFNATEIYRLKYDLLFYKPPLQEFLEEAGKKTVEIATETISTLKKGIGAFGQAIWKKTKEFYPYTKWFAISTGKIFHVCGQTTWAFGKATWKAAWKKLHASFSTERQQYVENCQQNVEKIIKMLGQKICDGSRTVGIFGKTIGKTIWKKTKDLSPYVKWFAKITGQRISDYRKMVREFGQVTWQATWRKINEIFP